MYTKCHMKELGVLSVTNMQSVAKKVHEYFRNAAFCRSDRSITPHPLWLWRASLTD